MFTGTFEHALDDKGRLVLPSAFRSQLADRAFVTKLDGCLGVWAPDEFEKVASLLHNKQREGEVDQMPVRSFFADTHETRVDGQGRISIPDKLRESAGLDRDVVVNGRFVRIEVWEVDRWASRNVNSDEMVAEAVAQLGI